MFTISVDRATDEPDQTRFVVIVSDAALAKFPMIAAALANLPMVTAAIEALTKAPKANADPG